ncbi:MAG TPA: BsuBI/PstI family type II restriction endonuclease, partial [bacterium]|nr:BsuBI/PstI family type II restriction endonuclease [bacterium]
GKHSELIRSVIEDFGPCFVPGGELVYVGDTGKKWGYFDEKLLSSIGVKVEEHGKMPDVVIYYRKKNWLVLAEAVSSSGPVDGIRHDELSKLFKKSTAGLVYVTAFPDRGETFRKFLSVVAWETEVWCASDPTHLIHFNGTKFLGPY